jgi:hypothetical protein
MSSNTAPLYMVFLLSDKRPNQIIFDGEDLEKIVKDHSGIFTTRSFTEYLEAGDENKMRKGFRDLFQEFRSNVDVLIIDLDFFYKLWNIEQNRDDIRKYLAGIFCLSFMSAKRSECIRCEIHNNCKNCVMLKECKLSKLHVLTIDASLNQKHIFPEFIKWLRDRELGTHDIPISSKQVLKSSLVTIDGRFRHPLFKLVGEAMAFGADQAAKKTS